jgi:hypothetical protein
MGGNPSAAGKSPDYQIRRPPPATEAAGGGWGIRRFNDDEVNSYGSYSSLLREISSQGTVEYVTTLHFGRWFLIQRSRNCWCSRRFPWWTGYVLASHSLKKCGTISI